MHAGFDDDRNTMIARGLVLCGAFAVLLAAVWYGGRPIASPPSVISARNQTPNIPDTVGRSSYPLPDGKTCRQNVYDRTSSEIIDSVTAPCVELGRMPEAFRPRSTAPGGFAWGAK